MKKALSLILALVLCLGLCACGNSNKIALTQDNIETYFDIEAYMTRIYGYDEDFEVVAKLEGVSENYNYENVSVTFKICRTAMCGNAHEVPYEKEITVTTNIAGDGKTLEHFNESDICNVTNHSTDFTLEAKSTWEIVSISGYIVPAG